jgi:hypothetical protein
LSRRFPGRSRNRESGQALVLVVIGLGVVLAGTAMVVDGGNGMAQQRQTQNATDAAALAGALTIAQDMGGENKVDGDVRLAMEDTFADNTTSMGTGQYIDFERNVVGTVGRGGSIPSDAAGVQVAGSRTFNTFLAGIMGIGSLTSGANATALAGSLRSICSAADGCGVVPVTFSIPITTCDGTNRALRLGEDWPVVSLDVARADTSGQYESIVPLCTNGPGGVGWLDMGCGGNLFDEIQNACNGPFDIPTWLHTASGDVNNVESAFDEYEDNHLKLMLLPMFDATCRDIPTTGLPADCTDPGNGDNLYYHIPQFAEFLLDEAFIQGNNHPECNTGRGQPYVGGNGSTSCFKGWFVRYIMQGKVGKWLECDASVQEECIEPLLGVQLVR